jgi:hypothetical protein
MPNVMTAEARFTTSPGTPDVCVSLFIVTMIILKIVRYYYAIKGGDLQIMLSIACERKKRGAGWLEHLEFLKMSNNRL